MSSTETIENIENNMVAATGLTGMIGERVCSIATRTSWVPLNVNLLDDDSVFEAVRNTSADVIVNFAGFTDVTKAWQGNHDEDSLCYQVNTAGVERLADACLKYGKFLVQISTDYVFKGEENRVYTEADEGDANDDWYGVTKKMAENIIRNKTQNAAIVRIASPFQAYSERKEDLVRRMIRQMRENSLPPMFNDTAITPTYADDLAKVLEEIVIEKKSGTFHGVGNTTLSPYELAIKVAEAFELTTAQIQPGHIDDYIKKSGRPYPKFLRMSNEVTRLNLGIEMSSIEQSLAQLRGQIEDM